MKHKDIVWQDPAYPPGYFLFDGFDRPELEHQLVAPRFKVGDSVRDDRYTKGIVVRIVQGTLPRRYMCRIDPLPDGDGPKFFEAVDIFDHMKAA